jgi:hypothetical protein
MEPKEKMPNLKDLKVGDLFSLITNVVSGFSHKEDCTFTKQGICSCGLDKLRKDTIEMIQNIPKGDTDVKKD